MTWSENLAEAVASKTKGSRVPLGVGQNVEVRTKSGELVAVGSVQELVPKIRAVRIADQQSGSDLQIELDPEMYDVWVVPTPVVGDAPTPTESPGLSVNPHRPGAYTGGRFRV